MSTDKKKKKNCKSGRGLTEEGKAGDTHLKGGRGGDERWGV